VSGEALKLVAGTGAAASSRVGTPVGSRPDGSKSFASEAQEIRLDAAL
jgi:hypothetical protein